VLHSSFGNDFVLFSVSHSMTLVSAYQLANSHAVVSLYAPLEFFKLYLFFGVEFQKFSSITKHLFAGYLYSISASTVSPRWEKVLSLSHSLLLFMHVYVHSFK